MNPLQPGSRFPALVVFISIPLFFGIGQEIVAFPGSHDDFYFILRAVSLNMHGSYLAPIKELLYPLFIRISWIYGLGLRNFEVICYGIALFYLWSQIVSLTGNRLIGWLTVFPLTLFSCQHAVFNHATYDALQLILLPLNIATAINLYLKKAAWSAVALAGTTVGLMVLNRPEGILFILPPLVSLAALWLGQIPKAHFFRALLQLLPKGVLLLVIALLSQQVASAVNWRNFGFWAPTLIKAGNYQRCLTNLMAIDPGNKFRLHYITVPKTSLAKAYQVSPTLRKAKPLLDQQLNGYGWSSFAPPGYRAADGSISGGHFQWALLDTGSYVAGQNVQAMLAYFGAVADELDRGFANGTLKRRQVLTTALGPEFSFFDRSFWLSLLKISKLTFGFGAPNLPSIATSGTNPVVDAVFDTVALRRTALLDSTKWQLTGWVIHPNKGVPKNISLDQTARKNGIELEIKERPGLLKALPDLQYNGNTPPRCGIVIKSPGSTAGSLQMFYDDQTVLLPLLELRKLTSGQAYDQPSIHLQVDNTLNPPSHWIIPMTAQLTKIVFYTVRGMFCAALLLSTILIFYRKSLRTQQLRLTPYFLITALSASIIVPRLILFAAIDSNMYIGTEIRYLAPGTFAVWLFATFTVSDLFIQLTSTRQITNEIT